MFRKKLYTLLAVALATIAGSLTANATKTAYIQNTGSTSASSYIFHAWTTANSTTYEMDYWGTVYLNNLPTVTVSGTTYYVVRFADKDNSTCKFMLNDGSNSTAEPEISDGYIYTLNGSTLSVTSSTLSISDDDITLGDACSYLTLRSDGTSWESDAPGFYMNAVDVYTYTWTEGSTYTLSGQAFQVVTTSTDGTSYWMGTKSTLTLGTAHTATNGGSNNTMPTLTSGTSYTYTIEFEENYKGVGYNWGFTETINETSESSSSSGDDTGDDTDTSSTIWLSGAFNNWPSSSSSVDGKYVFTQSEDDENTWTLTVSNFSSYFKILIDGTWYGTTDTPTMGDYYGYTTTQMTSGITLASGDSGHNIIMLLTDGSNDETYVWESVTFTLKYSNGTYTLYAEADSSWHEGGSSGYYLMCGDNSWSASSSYEFIKSSTENVYTLTLSTFTADSNGFKVASSDWSTVNLTSSSALTVASSESVATSISLSTDSGDTHIYYSSSETTYASITFVLTYTNSSWTLCAYATTSYTLSTSSYDYYIVGDWNEIDGLWLPNPLGKLTGSNGTYTATISDFYGYFKVLAVPTGRYDIEDGIWLTCADSYKVALSSETEIASNYSNDATENNMAVVSSTTEYSSLIFTLAITDGETTATLTVTQNTSSSTEDTSGTDTDYYLVTSFNDYSYNVTSTKTESSTSTTTSTTSITYTVTFSSADVYNNFIADYGNNISKGVYAYAWYYTEDGTEVRPLGDWPGTDLEFTAYNDVKSFTLPTTTSLNLVVNNSMSYDGVCGGTYDGAQQTKDIVPGAYYGTYGITITDASKTDVYCDNSYYADYETEVEPTSEINIYVVPDETLGNDKTTAPTLHIFDTSDNILSGSWASSTATMTIDQSTGKYLWKYTVSSPSTVLGLVMHNGSDQTVDITGIAADVYLNYVAGNGATNISADNYKTLALNIDVSGEDSSSSTDVDNDGWKFKTIKISGGENLTTYDAVYFKAVIVQLDESAETNLSSISNIECTDGDLTMLTGYADDFGELASSESFYVQQGNTGNRYGHQSGTVDYASSLTNGSVTGFDEDDGWYEYLKGTYLTQLDCDWEEKNSSADYMLFLIGTDYTEDATILTTKSGGRYVAVLLATETSIASGIEKVDSEGNVIVAETYYTIQGLQVQNPEDRQFYIVVRKYADGSVKAFKEAIR